jgi:hypothetical protein
MVGLKKSQRSYDADNYAQTNSFSYSNMNLENNVLTQAGPPSNPKTRSEAHAWLFEEVPLRLHTLHDVLSHLPRTAFINH